MQDRLAEIKRLTGRLKATREQHARKLEELKVLECQLHWQQLSRKVRSLYPSILCSLIFVRSARRPIRTAVSSRSVAHWRKCISTPHVVSSVFDEAYAPNNIFWIDVGGVE